MDKYIEKYKNEVLLLNDYMADNPEIGGEEVLASRGMVDLLRKYDIQVEYPFNNMDTAFRGIINPHMERKAAILVEYDALRGIGHGCGHCASGSISILAALVLNEIKNKIPAQIHIIGTPDEEMRGGKVPMVNDGVFNGFDFAIMIHMNNINALYSQTLALDAYEICFHGKPAHAASAPWEGRNALNAMRLFFDATDMMRQHVKDDVRIHGYIQNGGDASNTVPHMSKAEVLVRAKERDYLDDVSRWVLDCAKAAALATRTTYEVKEVGEKYDGLKRNLPGELQLKKIYEDLNIPLVDISHLAGGSSDIGNVSSVCPAFHPYISIGEDYSVHTKEFAGAMKEEKTHQAILDGGKIISQFIVDMYYDAELLNEVKNYKDK